MKEKYSKLYNQKPPVLIDKPNKKDFSRDSEGYIHYLTTLKTYYGQLVPQWEFYVGNESYQSCMLYLLLYDFKADNYQVHWWTIDEDSQNNLADLHCNIVKVPDCFSWENEQDVCKWLIGHFDEEKYFQEFHSKEITKIIHAKTQEVVFCHSKKNQAS